MKLRKIWSLSTMIFVLVLSGCTSTNGEKEVEVSESDENYPLRIQHAFGESILEKKPENVATISWGNQDVPLALGVIPVGASKANYGVQDTSGLLPWTIQKYQELGVETPVLFDDTDSLDYEAIANTDPDVILAAYSGITQEDYALLSKIAPVIAYEDQPWQTLWRAQILQDSVGMGMKTEGEELVKQLDALIEEKVGIYPQLQGKSAAFCYFSPTDLGQFYIYLPNDPRAAYLTDFGLEFPSEIKELAENNHAFSVQLSSENIELLKDVDILIAYGNDDLLKAMQADALLGTLPAIKRGSIALFEDGSSLAASATPTALSIPASIDEYLLVLKEAADKVQ